MDTCIHMCTLKEPWFHFRAKREFGGFAPPPHKHNYDKHLKEDTHKKVVGDQWSEPLRKKLFISMN